MRVTVRLFARFRELAGAEELTRDVPDSATVGVVWHQLMADVPALAAYERSLSCAVNAEYAKFTTTVTEGDEIAFLPPVSGG